MLYCAEENLCNSLTAVYLHRINNSQKDCYYADDNDDEDDDDDAYSKIEIIFRRGKPCQLYMVCLGGGQSTGGVRMEHDESGRRRRERVVLQTRLSLKAQVVTTRGGKER